MNKSHMETARRFGQMMAIKRGDNKDINVRSLTASFWSMADCLTNDHTKHQRLAISAKTGFDLMARQNGWSEFKDIVAEEASDSSTGRVNAERELTR